MTKKDGRRKKIVPPLNTAINMSTDNARKIGDCCGVYVLITRSGRTYIGSSQNIRKRIVQHIYSVEYISDLIDEIVIYVTKNVGSARKLEKTLIMEIRPDINITL